MQSLTRKKRRFGNMKKILVTLFLSLLISSAFAIDWVRYGTYESADVGTYDVYFDYEATEPFALEKESIIYLLYLQKGYEKVEVRHIENKDWYWCNKGAELGYYATLERYKDCWVEDHINSDGTVTEYIFSGFKK